MVVAGSSDIASPGPARAVPSLRRGASSRVRLEHVVMAGAVLCLIVLVVLPICFLLAGSFTAEGGFSLANFRAAFGGHLYLQALLN